MSAGDKIMEVNDLYKHFPIYAGFFRKQDGAVKAVVDTGSSRTIQNTAAGRPIDPSVATSLDEMRVRGAASDSTLTTLSTPLQVILAGRLITAVVIPRGTLHVFKVWALEDTPAVLLGMDVLGACRRLIIDYPRSELLLPD